MVAKLADFGLARFASHRLSDHTVSQTSTIGKTATIRGTLAYLPDEYVRNGKLGTAVDVYSFGVVRHCGKCCLLVQTEERFRFKRKFVPKRLFFCLTLNNIKYFKDENCSQNI